MTPVFLFLLLLPLTASQTRDETDDKPLQEGPDVSETIANANDGIKTYLVHGDIVPNMQRNADPCVNMGCKWPKRGPYVYVPVSISSAYTRAERNIIIRGLVTFHKSTCIRFVWRRRHRQYLHFYSGTGCWSYLGRQSRGQPVSLKKNGCLYTTTVQHEVLHALGFHHEHVRSDRDDYVSIMFQNIMPGKQGNFEKQPTNNLGTPYDFGSIMHYSKYAFSGNRQPTIVPKREPIPVFGYPKQMSKYDIARVNNLYKCKIY